MKFEEIRNFENVLSSGFIGREEEARVISLSLITKQHTVFIGEPGTAKSALLRRASQLISCKYFYYLLSKYTLPDELIGAIDPLAYKQGKFVRNIANKIPQANIVFIDEIFKGSSETLNALLNIMNEKIFVDVDGTVYQCPLHSLFGASNELPTDSELAAFYDRFLLRQFVKPIDTTKLENAIILNLSKNNPATPILSLDTLNRVYDEITAFMQSNASAIAKVVSQLTILSRQNGIFVSDRTACSSLHLPRLVASYSLVYGVDLKKSAIAVSKYILPNPEALEQYNKMLDSLLPPEIRTAQEKLEVAKTAATAGKLDDAERNALEAIQALQNIVNQPEKLELMRNEVIELRDDAEKIVTQIRSIKQQLQQQFKRRGV